MKTLIYTIILALTLSFMMGCKTKTVYVPVKETETITETIRDTVIDIQLVPYKDSIVTKDTISYLENKYTYSWAKWSNGLLSHSLGIFDNPIPTKIKYVDREVIKYIEIPYPVKGDDVPYYPKWIVVLAVIGGGAIGFGVFKLIRFFT